MVYLVNYDIFIEPNKKLTIPDSQYSSRNEAPLKRPHIPTVNRQRNRNLRDPRVMVIKQREKPTKLPSRVELTVRRLFIVAEKSYGKWRSGDPLWADGGSENPEETDEEIKEFQQFQITTFLLC